MVKEKLTLSVDKKVIEKAKKLGINISEITERVLRGYTSAQKPEKGSLYEGYELLFDSIIPLLKEFDIRVEIAEEELEFEDGSFVSLPVYLLPAGGFYVDGLDYYLKGVRQIELRGLLSPQKVLENLVDTLVKSEEGRKEKLKEIKMAKRIIDAMSETLIKRSIKRSEAET